MPGVLKYSTDGGASWTPLQPGPAGPMGATGPTGLAGVNGATGPTGPAGPPGIGRNRVINGDFSVNQRGTVDVLTNGAYGVDRWYWNWVAASGAHAYGVRSSVGGVLPEGAKQFVGIGLGSVTDPASYITFGQKIEGVRSLSGKTVTVSFWARGDTPSRKIGVQFVRNFGTGGSPSASEHFDMGIVTLTDADMTMTGAFKRYSVTAAIPAWGSQVEGTNGDSRITVLLYASCGPNAAGVGPGLMPTIGVQNGNIHLWGVQVEEGPVATEFERRTPGEVLAQCQRYFQRLAFVGIDAGVSAGVVYSNTMTFHTLTWNGSMRRGPAITAIGTWEVVVGLGVIPGTLGFSYSQPHNAVMNLTASVAMTVGQGCLLRTGGGDGYIDLDAEL